MPPRSSEDSRRRVRDDRVVYPRGEGSMHARRVTGSNGFDVVPRERLVADGVRIHPEVGG